MCPCCGRGDLAQVLVLWLDVLRRAWGGPVAVNSGWRCARHNARVGGSKSSRHMIGCAADIRSGTGEAKPPEFAALAARLFRLPGWEFLLYGSFIHVAAPRQEGARLWSGGAVEL